MTTFGMTDQGFVPKRLSDVLTSITEKIKNIEDPETGEKPFVNEPADSILTQFAQILSEELSICWEQAYLAANQFDPQNMTGVPLRGTVQINGINPSFGSYTEVPMTLGGTSGTTIPEGSLIADDQGKYVYKTTTSATIGEDGTVTVNAICTEKGPIEPAENTIISIQTPIFGWRSATNGIATSIGTNEDTDAQLHIKQERATSATSYRQVDAIISGIINVPGVKFARLYLNKTTTTDEKGIAPKTIAPVIVGGTDEDIANVIRLKAGALDSTQGTTSVSYTGPLGDVQTINFYRPTEVPVYIDIKISITENSTWQDNGFDLIKEAIIKYAEYDQQGFAGFPPGADVILSRLYTPINSVLGFKVNSLTIGTDEESLSANDISIAWNEIAKFDKDNINITVVA